ncbi:lasso peptide biosynthesis B2 protein [Sphingomonas sp. LB2R24]|uniref:lasso peptide biosynthesis B2 protein n=1 Tax=Sphingomonas sorbitolis TaxID=3096165 RepID=UPI002FC6B924
MSSLRRKLRTASGMTRADRRLIVEAIAALLVARRRSLLPFEVLARHLGGIVAPHSRTRAPASASAPAPAPVLPAPLSQAEADMIFAIRWSIGAVAPWLPFRTLCLQQAIAARAMLERRGIGSVLHLGVRDPTGTTLDAHAWLDAGGLNVTGYPVDPALTEVGRFV